MIPCACTYSHSQPIIHEIAKLDDLNTSSELWYTHVIKSTGSDPDLSKSAGSYVDVRDVALANVLAAENEAAGGQRILVSTGRQRHHRAPSQSLISFRSSVYLAGYE